MTFENPSSIALNAQEGQESAIEQNRINKLWRDYHLNGKPIKYGTPVHARLKETCENYINSIFNKKVNIVPGSDSYRRNMHNQIALMVDGNARSNMTPKRAEEIADFAAKFVHNLTISQLEELYTKDNE